MRAAGEAVEVGGQTTGGEGTDVVGVGWERMEMEKRGDKKIQMC